MKNIVAILALLGGLVAGPVSIQSPPAESSPASTANELTGFGYGLAVAYPDGLQASQMGFNWIVAYGPPKVAQPTHVLYRVPASAGALGNLGAFQAQLDAQITQYGGFIDAYEIGNEVNLGSEWGAAPVAADYVSVLCAASTVIRSKDPTATIVSAGLATVGRVVGSWNGHAGHNGSEQDERHYLTEFIQANGHACADAIGYHPMGFRAMYYAAPDVTLGTPETDCSAGLCFRSAEKIYEILQAHGLANRKIWATEVGWIVAPPDVCLSDPSWTGRAWQIVSPLQRAENVVGAFTYARSHWPWLEAMFLWNLNFNSAGYYSVCEQMRYYSIPEDVGILTSMFKDIYRIHLPLMIR